MNTKKREYYTSKEVNDMRKRNIRIDLNGTDPEELSDLSNLFVEVRSSSIGNYYEKSGIKLQLIDKEEKNKLIDYLKENEYILQNELPTILNISNDGLTIYAMLDKKIIKKENDKYILVDKN